MAEVVGHARAIAALVLLGALAGPEAVGAAPRAVCRLLPDARGDAGAALSPAIRTPPVAGAETDDIVSADVAADSRTLTAVWRMADLQAFDPLAPGGHDYTLSFAVRGTRVVHYYLRAQTHPTGTRFSYGDVAEDLGFHAYLRSRGVARGIVDVAHDQVRVHAPLAAFGEGLRRSDVLLHPQAAVGRVVGQGVVDPQPVPDVVHVPGTGTTETFDTAEGDRYVIGTRSCVRPGT